MGFYPFNSLVTAPSGAAGGDLSGTYPNPVVSKIGGQSLPLPVSLGGTGSTTFPVISGQYLCVPSSYAPASQVAAGASTTTLTAFSSSNMNTGNFTAPPSGSVNVEVTCSTSFSETFTYAAIGLLDHGGSTLRGYVTQYYDDVAFTPKPSIFKFLVAGLTPGGTYNFDLAGAAASGLTFTVIAIGQATTTPQLGSGTFAGEPVVMTVQAI